MLAGLLFADHEALDRPGQLTATLPFGGVSLIEYQARLLVGAGASQLIVSVGRLTPELLGALGRIGRRGIAVDAVRSAAEATEKLHPLSRVLMLADGLITTQDIVDAMAHEPADVLLVMPDADCPPEYERLGGRTAWAGVALLDPRRIAEVAALPRDYDLQSTTLRLAEQARAAHLPLPPSALHDGHGIEHSSQGMAARGRAVLAATVADRRNWFNTALTAPLARASVPPLVSRGVATALVAAVGGVAGFGGIVATTMGAPATGLVVALAGSLVLSVGAVLARLRDEDRLDRVQGVAANVIPAGAVLALASGSETSALAVAGVAMLVFVGILGLRAIRRSQRRAWWGTPQAYLVVLTIFTLAGHADWGIAATLLYAGATLTAAIESLRGEA
ncbi:hypothetical protein Q5H91_02720 [Sphingomonas sp. KR1UV-12]|uniref:MobA-like NTP transferase domain-containing protein n=1 Tax=Sphingomonas aurea TaxID=3063994 RepID=A0ABT9EGL3_9SPHN|nr:hypothetical protein [Sphingomonas sp. KR1UV-12]MDP1026112.1 hypothetical protein [Sphingomonas sp. KR1UV-12]